MPPPSPRPKPLCHCPSADNCCCFRFCFYLCLFIVLLFLTLVSLACFLFFSSVCLILLEFPCFQLSWLLALTLLSCVQFVARFCVSEADPRRSPCAVKSEFLRKISVILRNIIIIITSHHPRSLSFSLSLSLLLLSDPSLSFVRCLSGLGLGLGLGGVGGWGPENGTEESDIDKRRGTMSGLHFETDFFLNSLNNCEGLKILCIQ